jgi:hypothetical protein
VSSYTILGQTYPTANTQTASYTPSSGASALIRSVNIANTSASADTYSVAIVASSSSSTTNANYLAKNATIAGNSTVQIKGGFVVPVGGELRVVSTNGTCAFNTFGAEIL